MCLITEGSYPYVIGGTGEWTHRLLETLPDIDFSVVAISATPRQPSQRRYPALPNLRRVVDVALEDRSSIAPILRRRTRHPGGTKKAWRELGHIYRAFMRKDFSSFRDLMRLVRHDLSAWDLFHSRPHWELIEHYYRMLTPIEPFIEFYWTWRFTHLTLYQLMQQSLPAADIYHPIAAGYAGFLGACGRYEHNARMVLTEHGLYTRERELEIAASRWFRGYQKDFVIGLFDKMNRLIYSQSDLIVSLFEESRQAQINLGAPEERTVVIPNGLDLERFSAIPTRRRDDVVRIGLLGRVVPIKDVRAFIQIAKIVAETVPNTEFLVIGPTEEDPGYYAACQQLAEQLQLEGRLRFTGYQRAEECLPELDILALTSLKEAQPFSVLEAMACGLPVVSTRTGSVPEMLEGAGLMAPARDLQSFADAIIKLAGDPVLRREMGERARERVSTQYDQRSNLEVYRQHYERLAGPVVAEAEPTETA